MNGWMITPDGSAVNLARIERVMVDKRASHVDDTWYVSAKPAGGNYGGFVLADGLESREAAVAWIEQRFRSFDQHVDSATQVFGPRSLRAIVDDAELTNAAKVEEAKAAGYQAWEEPLAWHVGEPGTAGYMLRKPMETDDVAAS